VKFQEETFILTILVVRLGELEAHINEWVSHATLTGGPLLQFSTTMPLLTNFLVRSSTPVIP